MDEACSGGYNQAESADSYAPRNDKPSRVPPWKNGILIDLFLRTESDSDLEFWQILKNYAFLCMILWM